MAKAKIKTDPLNSLLNDAKNVDPKKSLSKKKQRNLIQLDPAEAAAFDRFCMADATLKMIKGHQEGSKATILPVLTDKLIQLWCEEGRRTDNPRVQTENGQAILQARENLRFDMPVGDDGEPGTVTDALIAVGFDHEKAEDIRKKEFTETTELRFADISKLRNDTATKKVVNKLLSLVIENFTAAERAILLEKVNRVTLNPGFLDRAVTHADNDAVKLKALFNVVRPTFLMSQIVWNGDLDKAMETLETENPKLTKTVALPKTFASPCGEWKAQCTGNEAKLFAVHGNIELEMLTKICTGSVHAEQTCKKWIRDEKYRTKSLTEK